MKIESNFDYLVFYNQGIVGVLTLREILSKVLPYLGCELNFSEADTCNYSVGKYGKFSRSYRYKIYGYGFSIFFDLLKKEDDNKDIQGDNIVFDNPFNIDFDVPLSVKIELTGAYFKDKNLIQSIDVFIFFSVVCKLYPSRIDYRIDDESYSCDWKKLFNYAINGDCTGIKKPPSYHGSRFDYEEDREKKEYFYENYTFGSRQSRKYLRVYDLFPKHGVKGMRYEVELTRDAASITGLGFLWTLANMGFYEDYAKNPFDLRKDFKLLIASNFDWVTVPSRYSILGEELADSNMKVNWEKVVDKLSWIPDVWDYVVSNSKILNHVVTLCDYYMRSICLGVVDFVDKSNQYSNQSLKNCSRYQEWQDWMDKVLDYEVFNKPIKIPSFTPLRVDIRKSTDWLINQVFFTLSAIRKGLGESGFGRFIYQLSCAEFKEVHPHLDNLRNYNSITKWIKNNFDIFIDYFRENIQKRSGYPEYKKFNYRPQRV